MIETLFELLDRGVAIEVNAKIHVGLQTKRVRHEVQCQYCSWKGSYAHKKTATRAKAEHEAKCEHRAAANGWIKDMSQVKK